jgi:hypothetical protein
MSVEDGADTFRDAVRQLIRQGRVKLVINYQACPYIDSTAPSNFTQFESYQTVDPSSFDQPILRVARIGGGGGR